MLRTRFRNPGRKPADGYLHYLAGVDDARFKRPVRPGDVLELEGSVLQERRQLMTFDCAARVDGELACTVKLLCVERKLETSDGATNPGSERSPAAKKR